MLSCYIVEDDPNTVKTLQTILETEMPTIDIKGSSDTIADAMVQIAKIKPDFAFLDINLKDKTSLDSAFLEVLKKHDVDIIFVTSESKHALEAFQLSAVDYVLKPFLPEDIVQAVKKLQAKNGRSENNERINVLLENISGQDKKIVLSDIDTVHIVKLGDIVYLKSDNNYTEFHVQDGEVILVSKTLKSYEKQLKPYLFIRIHQSFLINVRYISKFMKRTNEIILTDNTKLKVANGRKQFVLDYLEAL